MLYVRSRPTRRVARDHTDTVSRVCDGTRLPGAALADERWCAQTQGPQAAAANFTSACPIPPPLPLPCVRCAARRSSPPSAPPRASPGTLLAMVRAGMDVARLNYSHGTLAEHEETVRRVRDAAGRAGRPVAILQDLPGPKLRIGPLREDIVELKPGDMVTFTCGEEREGDARHMSITWPGSGGGAGARGGALPGRRLGASARSRPCASRRAKWTPRSRSAARSPPARASTSPAPPTRCRRCPRRISSCCATANRSVWTWWRCRSCATPPTWKPCASTRACP